MSPLISSLVAGVVVPIPTLVPLLDILVFAIHDVPLCLRVCPLVPVGSQPDAFCQLARPLASLVRTFPAHGAPPVILTCPATSSFAEGEEVQIPIFQVVAFIYKSVRHHELFQRIILP